MSENQITSTMEDYLETIFQLNKEKGGIRVKNIAKKMGVKMPTVTNMLKTLNEKGLVDYEKHEYLELTKKGLKVGRDIEKKHNVIRGFLVDILKLDPVTADEEACKMEHGMSPETLSRLTKFVEFVQSCPMAGEDWLKYFDEYCQNGFKPEKCKQHMDDFSLDHDTELRIIKQ